jgi:hypothetical protein
MAEDPKEVFKRMCSEPSDSASILGETPQNVLLLAGAEELRRKRIIETQRQRDAQLILENIQERPVFFYPGAGLDWEPLHRLTHECSVFVYCDWETQAGAVTGEFQLPGLKTEFIVPLGQGTVRDLSDASRFHPHIWRIVKRVGGPPVEPWGKYARLARSVGNITRTIHFFYLGIEGVTTYFNLFTPVRTAPKIICLKGAGGVQRNWTNFHDWDRPLGQLVRRCDTRPTHLIVDGGPHLSWPYTRRWQRFADWERSPAACVAENYLPELVQAKPLDGARRVIVKRGALTPGAVAGCDVIVLPISLYMRHREEWPAQARIMLLAPSNQEGQLLAHDDRVVFLGSKKAPLGNLLDALAQACTNLASGRVASVGIGYEDEGPELQKWREQTGSPLELTIYCEEEGDVASFGPYADEIH